MVKIIRPVIAFLLILMLCSTAIGAEIQMKNPKIKENEKKADSSGSEKYASEELLVKYAVPQNDEKITKKMEKLYGKEARKNKIEKDYSQLGLPNTYLIRLSSGEDPKEAKEKYKKDPEVVYAEPNYEVSIDLFPNDPSFSKLWGLHNAGQTGGTPDADIDAPEAWDLYTGSADVVIAVVDTGVDYTHPDLAQNIWINTDEIAGNGIDDDGNGYIDDIRGWDFRNKDNNPMDDHNHGTHCAGTIGATGANGAGVTGVMWNVRIMPLKFMSSSGSGYTSDAVAAILYANKNGAHVISNSWGGSSYSQTLKDAIDASSAVVVCAAGNSGKNIDTSPVYPASYSSTNLISVAATDYKDAKASFSNYGVTSVDVAAPGVSVYSTLKGGTYGTMSGTSMATPHVAGLAGLLKAGNPSLSAMEIRELILSNCDSLPSLQGKILTSGRINAYKALSSVQPAVLSVTSITPSSACNTSQVTTTLKGTGLDATPTVRMIGDGGTEIRASSVTWISSTQLTCIFDLTGQETGWYQVEVKNPDDETVTLSPGFEILAPATPVPTITSLSPSSAVANGPGFELTVTGTNFTPTSIVCWNGQERSTLYVNDTNLVATILSGDIVTTGTITITVTDGDKISNGKDFTVTSPLPAPTVSSVYPSSGRRGSGRTLTIYGTNFAPGVSAELRKTGYAPIKCTGVTILTTGKMTCTITIPSTAATGYWDMAVTNPDLKSGIKTRGFYIYY